MSLIVKGNPFPQSEEAIHATMVYRNEDIFYVSEIPEINQIIFSAKNVACAEVLLSKLNYLCESLRYSLHQKFKISYEDVLRQPEVMLFASEFCISGRAAKISVLNNNSHDYASLIIIPTGSEGAKHLIEKYKIAINELEAAFQFDKTNFS